MRSFFFFPFFCKQSFLCLEGNLGTKKQIFLMIFLYLFLLCLFVNQHCYIRAKTKKKD